MQLAEQLAIAEQLWTMGSAMLEPRELPGRFGRVIADVERLLAATGTPAVVAGGWAVWRHGFVGRVTQDVDIVVPRDCQDELRRAAPLCGFDVLDVPAGNWPKLAHRESKIEVDLLPEASFPGTSKRRAPVPIRHPNEYGAQPGALTYIRLENLIELKLGAHRAKDLADVVELVKVNRDQLQRVYASLHAVHPNYAEQLEQLVEQADEESN